MRLVLISVLLLAIMVAAPSSWAQTSRKVATAAPAAASRTVPNVPQDSPPPVLPTVARAHGAFRIALPPTPVEPQVCTLINPYGSVPGPRRTWGAVPAPMSRIDPTEDGSFLGMSWGTGDVHTWVGVTGLRCVTAGSWRVYDLGGYRIAGR